MIETVNDLWQSDWITVEGAAYLLGLDDIKPSQRALVIKAMMFRESLEEALLNYFGLEGEM